jgi:hypothetical protein
MQAAFEQAARAHPEVVAERTFLLADHPTSLRVVGQELAHALGAAFAHLPTTTEPPQLRLDLWDEASTGIPCPDQGPTEGLGPAWLAEDGQLQATSNGRQVRYARSTSLTWLDRARGALVQWRPSAAAVSLYERTKPFRLPLRILVDDLGVHLIHAGLVARNGQGALLAGDGGAGKSTTSLSCLRGGLDYLGDDYLGLAETEAGAFVGHSFYGTARVEPNHLQRFPWLRDHATFSSASDDPKALLFVNDLFPGQCASQAAIRVVLLPRVVDAETSRLVPASRTQALMALAPSTLLDALGPGRHGFERLSRLAARVPSYWLELGRDLAQIPECVHQALDLVGA